MNFSQLGWFTLTAIREHLPAEEFAKLREAIANRELPVVKFGKEYLLDDEDYRAWRGRAN